MTTLLISHPDCLGHDTSAGHPESADRLRAVLRALEDEGFRDLKRDAAPAATDAQILRAHPAEVLALVASAAAQAGEGYVRIDADTIVSRGSELAARRAAGAVCRAVAAVTRGEAGNAFCAVRPPGHHAESTRPMGFCLYNNVAIGALEARAMHGMKRVAVVDFDVHHGNGTQELFESDPDLFYASCHQWPFYPGTGGSGETGLGNIVNVPLAEGSGGAAFLEALGGRIIPALAHFRPDLLMISAGFDAHEGDPLAGLNVATEDFEAATDMLCAAAESLCGGRVVSTLEGGYNLKDLAASAAGHVRSLMRHG
ncbi:histone deacetylase family protein [Emcibacter sp. SYSU 3D8]|uniref:histone deacetylase family protein n=1 Tax=Emcibacter sp. SYSU 3D8 TaxID=3133969 RepID=UPI0031FF263A